MEIPDGYGQANFRFTGAAVPTGAEITFGIKPEGDVTTPELAAAALALAWLESEVMDIMTDQLTLSSILVKFGPVATGPSVEVAVGQVGQAESPALPPNTSVLVRKSTIAGGRAGSGRFYLPGFQEGGVTDSGTMSTETVGIFDTAWESFRTDLIAADCSLVLLHGADSPITTPTSILSLTTDARVATQRRRLRR